MGRKMKKLLEKIIYICNWQMNYSTWSKIAVCSVFIIIGGAALVAFTVDPFYRYREPFFYDKVYYKIYATAPSLLRNEDYNTLMMGTSMTRNFFLEDIDGAFGGRSIKLAAAGGTTSDLKKFFDLAKAAKKDSLERVIFSLDIYPLNKTEPHYKEFDFMYETGYSKEYRYLFSRQTFANIFYLWKRKLRPKRQRAHQTDRNRMFSSEYAGKKYGLEVVMYDADHNQKIHHTQTPRNEKAYRQNLKNELLPMFDENPQIDFIVFLPPYHIYTYCQSEEFGEADALIRQRSEVMLELLKRKNVKLFDFQADASYVCDHELFSDVQHFGNIAAKRLLKDITSGRRELRTAEDVKHNEAALRKLIAENMPLYFRNLKKFRNR